MIDDRLAKILERLQCSEAEWIRRAKCGRNILGRMRKGIGVSYHDVCALADAAGVSVDWLLGRDSPASAAPATVTVEGVANGIDGRGGIVREDHDAYRTSIKLPDGAHLVRIFGDSMVPVALDGQAVWVIEAKPVDGDLAVIEPREGPMLFKRVYRRDHGWECVSSNAAPEFKPIPLKDSEIRRIRKVVGTWWG